MKKFNCVVAAFVLAINLLSLGIIAQDASAVMHVEENRDDSCDAICLAARTGSGTSGAGTSGANPGGANPGGAGGGTSGGGTRPATGGGSGAGGGSGGGGGGGITPRPGNHVPTSKSCGGISTAIINCDTDAPDQAIFAILGIGLSIMTWGVAIGATIGFVISGYQYITAGANVAQVQKAKNRMIQIAIGLAIYAAFWGVMNWLLPGGLFGDGS